MWEGKVMVKVKVRGQGRSLYQLGYRQAPTAFLFIPGSTGVPGITGSQCSTFEENLCKSQGKASHFCICFLIQDLFEQRGAGYMVGSHFPCPHEAYSGVGLGNKQRNEQ